MQLDGRAGTVPEPLHLAWRHRGCRYANSRRELCRLRVMRIHEI